MANWVNGQLEIIGRREAVQDFRRRVARRPGVVFRWDMQEGEGGDLHSDPMKRFDATRALFSKLYCFQMRNDDGNEYFTAISRRYPSLTFVLAWWDPASDCGSVYLRRGRRSKVFHPTDEFVHQTMMRFGHDYDLDGWDNEWKYWQASIAITEVVRVHWHGVARRAHARVRR